MDSEEGEDFLSSWEEDDDLIGWSFESDLKELKDCSIELHNRSTELHKISDELHKFSNELQEQINSSDRDMLARFLKSVIKYSNYDSNLNKIISGYCV